MDWNEFNRIALRRESGGTTELDLRPFGARQSESLDFCLEALVTQGDPFGKATVLKTDATVVLSDGARVLLGKLQAKGIIVSVVGER